MKTMDLVKGSLENLAGNALVKSVPCSVMI